MSDPERQSSMTVELKDGSKLKLLPRKTSSHANDGHYKWVRKKDADHIRVPHVKRLFPRFWQQIVNLYWSNGNVHLVIGQLEHALVRQAENTLSRWKEKFPGMHETVWDDPKAEEARRELVKAMNMVNAWKFMDFIERVWIPRWKKYFSGDNEAETGNLTDRELSILQSGLSWLPDEDDRYTQEELAELQEKLNSLSQGPRETGDPEGESRKKD